MPQAGISRFDLYDFFSVFLPGATLLTGLSPLLPVGTNFTAGLAGLLIVLGYVTGRAVHGVAIASDDLWDQRGHRKMFVDQMSEPELLSGVVVERFLEASRTMYDGLDLHGSQEGSVDTEKLESLYTLVRSYIHIDSRGRSRTFQATYSFYRSMSTVVVVLFVVYYLYGVSRLLGVTRELGIDETYIGSSELPPLIVSTFPVYLGVVLFEIFYRSKRRHQRYYVQYLVSDFLTLHETREADSGDSSPQRDG